VVVGGVVVGGVVVGGVVVGGVVVGGVVVGGVVVGGVVVDVLSVVAAVLSAALPLIVRPASSDGVSELWVLAQAAVMARAEAAASV
jgi:hypothetical protein